METFFLLLLVLAVISVVVVLKKRGIAASPERAFDKPLISDTELLRNRQVADPSGTTAIDGGETAPQPVTSTSVRSSAADRWFLPERFVVFDLETTGFSPKSNEIIEIGAIKISRDFSYRETLQCLVAIEGPLPRKITELTGISRKMIKAEGRDPREAIESFIQFAGDLRLIAFNVKFDRGFLLAAAARYDLVLSNQFHCALEKARQAWPGRQSYKLQDIVRDGQLSEDGTHRALSDARRALIVYAAAMTMLHSKK